MGTREVTEEYRMSHWANVIQSRSDSGLSIKTFCAREGFSETKYYYWLKKLRKAACEGINVTPTRNMASLPPPRFTEVNIVGQPNPPLKVGALDNQIKVETGEVKITAGIDYPEDKLAAIIRELRAPC